MIHDGEEHYTEAEIVKLFQCRSVGESFTSRDWHARAIMTAELASLTAERDSLRVEVEKLRKALVDHNDLLRSAHMAAQRDATHDVIGTTNYRTLADRTSEVLARHHAVTNEARAALQGNPNGE